MSHRFDIRYIKVIPVREIKNRTKIQVSHNIVVISQLVVEQAYIPFNLLYSATIIFWLRRKFVRRWFLFHHFFIIDTITILIVILRGKLYVLLACTLKRDRKDYSVKFVIALMWGLLEFRRLPPTRQSILLRFPPFPTPAGNQPAARPCGRKHTRRSDSRRSPRSPSARFRTGQMWVIGAGS